MANRAILKTLLRILIIFLLNLIVPVFVFADNGKILFHNFEKDVPWIYSINADGADLKKIIKNGLYPLWSPDREMIAYLSPTSGGVVGSGFANLLLKQFFVRFMTVWHGNQDCII